jgi:hypothetical protein
MNLLPKHIRKQLPKLYATEHVKTADKIAVVKFFTPDSSWTWYVCEFDGCDTFFGFVIGLEAEWGYISLAELQSARGPLGLPIERDAYWRPKPMHEAEPRFFAEGGHE